MKKTNSISKFLGALVLLVGPAVACSGDAASDGRGPEVTIPQVDGSRLDLLWTQDALVLAYDRAPDQKGPRMAEIVIRHSGNVRFDHVEAGEAAMAAGKRVIVQAQDETTMRVLVFATQNTTEVDSGTLATLYMERTDEESARAEILLDKPVFAPRAALEGLHVGEAVTF